MALCRRHVFDRAVTMLIVVPGNELVDPRARCFDTLERLAGIGWRVLERAEQALGVWVVVAHRWSAERWDDAQPLQRRQHGGALHGAPVVSVQGQLAKANTFCQTGFADQGAGVLCQLFRVDFPTHDLAAEDVLNHVQPIELSADTAGEEGDIPTPDLIGRCGAKALGFCHRPGLFRGTAAIDLLGITQDPVKARLRGEISARIGKARHNLCGRQAAELRQVAHADNLIALHRRECIAGRAGLRRSLALVTEHGQPECPFPPLQCSHINLQYSAGARGTRTCSHRFTNQGNRSMTIGLGNQSSSLSPQISRAFFGAPVRLLPQPALCLCE